MILILRGHIRNSFDTNELYNLVKKMNIIVPELKIYIHTWGVFANTISWRKIEQNDKKVNDEIIYKYFADLSHLIKHIIIEDDSKIDLIGNLQGNINNSPMPIIGWKNYWYGKHKINDFIYKNVKLNKDENVINCRFDVLNNSNIFTEDKIVKFVINNSNKEFNKNVFLFDKEERGIDNIYIGNMYTMYKLTHTFVYNLDKILEKNKSVFHQEFLVYRINNVIFRNIYGIVLHRKRVKNNVVGFNYI